MKLQHDSVPMRLYHEAKQLGAWDPRRLDFTRDAADWARLSVTERDVLLRLTALFQAAEESMTRDLLPLIMTVVRENRLEEELFLTTFLAEEAKHTEFFRRVLDDVCRQSGDMRRYHTPSFERVFGEKLPAAMRALLDDPSPAAQAEALAAYTLVGEGVLGEAGYQAFFSALDGGGIMPGVREGLRLAQADEGRHMAYGLFLINRLAAEDDGVWDVIDRSMNDLLPLTLGVVSEFFQGYDTMPFELSLESTIESAMAGFAARWESLEQARAHARRAAGSPGPERTERELLAWLRERAQPAAVDVRREGQVYTVRIGPEGTAALFLTQDVLEHHSPAEIIATLVAHGVADRLERGAPLRLVCLSVAGRISVQESSPSTSFSIPQPRAR